MDPATALKSVETVLRLTIRSIFPFDEWLDVPGAPTREELERRQTAEAKRRDGSLVPSDLLFYAEIHHLTKIVEKEWALFKPIFRDLGRTRFFFNIILDVRNTVAHSRRLLPFERELLSGAAGQLSNQYSIYRSEMESSNQYYPTIETVADSFGVAGGEECSMRLNIGQPVRFEGLAASPRGHSIRWYMSTDQPDTMEARCWEIGSGLELNYDWIVADYDVGEDRRFAIYIVSENKYHRHEKDWGTTHGPFDDVRWFAYSVNPPMD